MTTSLLLQPQAQRRRWHQYGLRTLLIVMTVVGSGLGWLGIKVQAAWRQAAAAEAIKKDGGTVWYDYQVDATGKKLKKPAPSQPAWLRSLLGNDLFDRVVAIQVSNDEQLLQLKNFPHVTSLRFSCTEQVSDAGLVYLQDAAQLRTLIFGANRNVTDAGLARLKVLTQLEHLDIQYLHITEAGLDRLCSLPQLRTLTINRSLKPAVAEKLRQVLPNCEIDP